MVDAHCHLYDEKLNEIRQIILDNIDRTQQICICSGDNVFHSLQCIKLAEENKYIYATVGTHPHEAIEFCDKDLEMYAKMCKNKKVVAIGEIGLDYFYDLDTKDLQKEVLKKQIVLADKLGKPCVFHIREAMGDFLEIVKEYKNYFKNSSVIHSFSGSVESAKILINYGFYISINGICTFKNASKILDVIKEIPLSRMLIETDSPYLAPVPHRGELNRPEYVELIAEKIAELKGISLKEVLTETENNAKRVFKIN